MHALAGRLVDTHGCTDEADLGVSASQRRTELAIDGCSEVFAGGIRWLLALSAAWALAGQQFVNNGTMQAGSPGLRCGYRFRC